jgi:hypothetical protein
MRTQQEHYIMIDGFNPHAWRRATLFTALTGLAALTVLPAGPAAAFGAAGPDAGPVLGCQLGSAVNYDASCVFDTNGDGVYDWSVSDTDGDSIFDTSSLDTDFDGRAETFYTIAGSPYGEVRVRYDHDGDWLYDDEETGFYFTDPWLWDTDGDGFGDNREIGEGSDPLSPYCTPYGCG